jgi:hypothetical protein
MTPKNGRFWSVAWEEEKEPGNRSCHSHDEGGKSMRGATALSASNGRLDDTLVCIFSSAMCTCEVLLVVPSECEERNDTSKKATDRSDPSPKIADSPTHSSVL